MLEGRLRRLDPGVGAGFREEIPVTASRPIVGVLGIQGDIEKHLTALERLGAEGRRVLVPKHLEGLAGLVLPGGRARRSRRGSFVTNS